MFYFHNFLILLECSIKFKVEIYIFKKKKILALEESEAQLNMFADHFILCFFSIFFSFYLLPHYHMHQLC